MAQIFVSQVQNPYQNLALEHKLLHTVQEPALFLYVNSPSVVIGRAQNPWVEANFSFLKSQKIPLVRRQSGGGAVVHDQGNLNFSFISPKALYSKKLNLQIVLDALVSLGVPALVNERHDILLEGKKISGSAFRETRDNCFHHGTLLIHADLSRLRQALAAPARKIKTNAVSSVRSAVMNIHDFCKNFTFEDVKQQIIKVFSLHYQSDKIQPVFLGVTALKDPLVKKELQIYQSIEWIYHKTLPFEEEIEIQGQVVRVFVENGIIVDPMPKLMIGVEELTMQLLPYV